MTPGEESRLEPAEQEAVNVELHRRRNERHRGGHLSQQARDLPRAITKRICTLARTEAKKSVPPPNHPFGPEIPPHSTSDNPMSGVSAGEYTWLPGVQK
jgi:hypothetical protein